MSFILDALKKSETDRQRQSGPALFEVKVASPRPRFPLWAIAVAALLLINLAIVGVLVLRRPPSTATTAAREPRMLRPSAAPVAGGGAGARLAPPVRATSAAPSRAEPDPGLVHAPVRLSEPTLARDSASEPADARAVEGNADDFTPATEPTDASKGHVRRGTESGYTLYQDAAIVPGANLPQLRLDLHVYASRPQDRFALINMHKLHEGDSLPEGVRVESIIPDGVVMSHNGSKFLLPRE
jgi:general secretion pathway protein B